MASKTEFTGNKVLLTAQLFRGKSDPQKHIGRFALVTSSTHTVLSFLSRVFSLKVPKNHALSLTFGLTRADTEKPWTIEDFAFSRCSLILGANRYQANFQFIKQRAMLFYSVRDFEIIFVCSTTSMAILCGNDMRVIKYETHVNKWIT